MLPYDPASFNMPSFDREVYDPHGPHGVRWDPCDCQRACETGYLSANYRNVAKDCRKIKQRNTYHIECYYGYWNAKFKTEVDEWEHRNGIRL